jgi:uncharacterized protein
VSLRVVIAGSSGLIGTALRRSLEADGHTVVRLMRGAPWDPGLVEGADAVVNLAGAGLGDRRWSASYKEVMLRSRTGTAADLAAMAARAARPPGVLISASGMRYYGIDRGDEVLTEDSAPGPSGFLPMVAREWEAATRPAADAGVPVCHLRMGLVLSGEGGVLPKLVTPFRMGLGGRFGSGEEYWSYVSLTDTVRAIRFLIDRPGARGPYNITAPGPVRSREFTRALAAAVGRPAALRVPIWVLRAALGEVASEVFGGLRVLPGRLAESGFRFEHEDVGAVLRDALG